MTILFFAVLAITHAGQSFAAPPANDSKVTIYRCIDTKGKVSLQDSPCAKTSKQETREMLRPKDAPPAPKPAAPAPAPIIVMQAPPEPMIQQTPPPLLYQCTNYEGKVRDSETYDINQRCEPLWALGYDEAYLPPGQAGHTCRWIQDSCVRYEGRALCDRWRAKQKQAQSEVRYAFSDTAAYRKSELARITQIVNNSCQ